MPTENEFGSRAASAIIGQYPELDGQDADLVRVLQGSFDAYMKAKYGDKMPRPRDIPGRNIPPTVEEVQGYFKEQASTVDPLNFWHFYNSKDWKVGDAPMKNWHSSAALWMRKAENQPQAGGNVRNQGSASLFALQAQLKTIETEMESILYPGGSQFKMTPTGKAAVRFDQLYKQRLAIKEKIDGFAQ